MAAVKKDKLREEKPKAKRNRSRPNKSKRTSIESGGIRAPTVTKDLFKNMPGASSRAQAMKAEREFDIRKKISNSMQLNSIFNTIEKLDDLYEELEALTIEKFYDEHSRIQTRLTALKLKLDIHMRLLNKIVPDLKAIDWEGEDGNRSRTPLLRLTVHDSATNTEQEVLVGPDTLKSQAT